MELFNKRADQAEKAADEMGLLLVRVDPNADETNCSECLKCNRTLVALDALGKLDEYSGVFDINKYRKNKKVILKKLAKRYYIDPFSRDNYDFCKLNGMDMPSLGCSGLKQILKTNVKMLKHKE